MSRRVIYDCTPDFAAREKFLGELLGYKKIQLRKSTFVESKTQLDALAILVDPMESLGLLPQFTSRSQDVEKMQFFDTVVYSGGRLWPNCFYRHAFKDLVFSKCPSLNTRLRCYLAGEHPLLLPAIDAFSKLGISQYCWITKNTAAVEALIRLAKSIFIGLNIEVMKTMELTLQANNGCVVINGVVDPSESDILDDLAYLNFLDHPGLIVDLESSVPVEWGTTEDATQGYPKASRSDLLKMYDTILMKEISLLVANKT